MADLMGVMLKSLGVNPQEMMQVAGDMQKLVGDIHAQLSTLIRQQELIIVHLSDGASKASPLYHEADVIMTRMLSDGTLAGCATNDSGDSVVGD
jgi:hypothetical protein